LPGPTQWLFLWRRLGKENRGSVVGVEADLETDSPQGGLFSLLQLHPAHPVP
jgi:hypothetical protein